MGRRHRQRGTSIAGMTSRERLHRVFGETDAALAEDAARKSSRQFVRGRTQISPFDPSRRPRGQVISALDAFEAYGFDVLEEAVEYGSAILLKRPNAVEEALRRQREALGLDYPPVARRIGMPVADLERIETGSAADVPMPTIERIAFTLGLDEAQIAFRRTSSGAAVAARLKTLQREVPDADLPGLSPRTVVSFAEAALGHPGAASTSALARNRWSGGTVRS